MVTPDENRLIYMPVVNAAWELLEPTRNEPIGHAENLKDCKAKEIMTKYIASERRNVEEDLQKNGEQLTPEKEKFIRENTNLSFFRRNSASSTWMSS